MKYDSETCYTAGELRDMGTEIPESIPDCAWIPKWGLVIERCEAEYGDQEGGIKFQYTSRLLVPFQWVSMGVVIKKE